MLRRSTWLLAAWLSVASVLGAEPPPTQDALNTVISRGQYEPVAALIAAGADVNAPDRQGRRPLFLAALGGNARIVELLLSKGAEVQATSTVHDFSLRIAFPFSGSEHGYERM